MIIPRGTQKGGDMVDGDKLREWKRDHLYRLSVDMNRDSEHDKPLIEKLEEQDNKAAYVKNLIRQDIENGGDNER